MEGKHPFCRKCLLSDLEPEGVYRSVAEYIASLDASVRCDDELYAVRLGICRECEKLNQGMCELCGCYVEARAAKRKQNCPALPHRW